MQYRPPNAYQEVSNTNHFGFVADSLGGLATTRQCMASSIYSFAKSDAFDFTATGLSFVLNRNKQIRVFGSDGNDLCFRR